MTPPALKKLTDDSPGFYRKKWGRGFQYTNHKGQKVADKKLLTRFRELVIPPDWREVWISPTPKNYLQATGRDAQGRKQYIYHPDWHQWRQNQKFAHMAEFGLALRRIRPKVEQHMRRRGWPRKKVLGLMVALLDETGMRIGNPEYSRKNRSYGLSTLRRRHLNEEGSTVALRYRAKAGKDREVNIHNRRLARLLKRCAELPGYELFRYQDNDGRTQCVDSSEVNQYIRKVGKGPFSSKNFRTWNGTVLAIQLMPEARKQVEENPRRKLDAALVSAVAQRLGNTPSVCRDYYIHPRVLEACLSGEVDKWKGQNPRRYPRKLYSENEIVLLNLLREKS